MVKTCSQIYIYIYTISCADGTNNHFLICEKKRMSKIKNNSFIHSFIHDALTDMLNLSYTPWLDYLLSNSVVDSSIETSFLFSINLVVHSYLYILNCLNYNSISNIIKRTSKNTNTNTHIYRHQKYKMNYSRTSQLWEFVGNSFSDKITHFYTHVLHYLLHRLLVSCVCNPCTQHGKKRRWY